MFNTSSTLQPDNTDDSPYAQLHSNLRLTIEGERDFIANASNCAAILFHGLPDINWAGFYFLRGSVLVLGPFQGKPACVRIETGKGVCGTAIAHLRTLVVPDVHEFPGHIACDAASRSEIVVPLIRNCVPIGVLDIDSPQLGRFDQLDANGLQAMMDTLLAGSDPQ